MHLVGKVNCLFILVALAKAFKMNSMARISLSENCAGFPDIFSSFNLSPSWDVQNGEWALRRVVFQYQLDSGAHSGFVSDFPLAPPAPHGRGEGAVVEGGPQAQLMCLKRLAGERGSETPIADLKPNSYVC
jgi:hypothetical protein